MLFDRGKTPDKSKDGRGPRPVPSSTHPRSMFHVWIDSVVAGFLYYRTID